jgi:hypothetical protein
MKCYGALELERNLLNNLSYKNGHEIWNLECQESTLVGAQEAKCDKGGTEPADDCKFFYGNGNANHHLGTGFLVHKGIISAVKRVEFFSDRMSYIPLRGCWCDIIVLNVHKLRINVMIQRTAFMRNWFIVHIQSIP